jgi:hypothetical protein
MPDIRIVKVDHGAVNNRILAREVRTDFRRIEAASVKMTTRLMSSEAKRLFVRFFHSLQLNAHFISVIARVKLKHDDIERVEAALRERLEAVGEELNTAIDAAEALFKANGITSSATYDTQSLEIQTGVISSVGRRYFEILHKLDQFMPMLQTLEIHEVVTVRDADIQRAHLKRIVRGVAGTTRQLASGLRRRMNDLAPKDGDHARAKTVKEDSKPDAGAKEDLPAAPALSSGVHLVVAPEGGAASATEA